MIYRNVDSQDSFSCLQKDDEPTESLWIQIKESDTGVGIRLGDQEEVDNAHYK